MRGAAIARQHTAAYVSMHVSIRQHTSAYLLLLLKVRAWSRVSGYRLRKENPDELVLRKVASGLSSRAHVGTVNGQSNSHRHARVT